jgi:streptogramin lyase
MSRHGKNPSIASRLRVVCLGLALLSAASAARAQVITDFSAGITPGAGPSSITAGPDGNLWFTECPILAGLTAPGIGRITPAGVVTEFSAGGGCTYSITAGPDGNLWFTERDRIGRITPAGAVTEFSAGISVGARPGSITAGPDGNLWFTESLDPRGRIGRITPAGVVTEFSAGITGGIPSLTPSITAGPDGNIWFTEIGGHFSKIGRITPVGVVTEFISADDYGGGRPMAITSGPDGNLWFTDMNSAFVTIGRITPLGVITKFSTAYASQVGFSLPGITSGSDGNLWFTVAEFWGAGGSSSPVSGWIDRITPQGVITEFRPAIVRGRTPLGITSGPDGALWFAEPDSSYPRLNPDRIGQITVSAAFFPLTPCRVVDTRNPAGALGGPPLLPAGSADRSFAVAGTCGIPVDAVALSVNVTVTNAEGTGNLSLYPGNGAPTGVNSISFAKGQTRANNGIVQVAVDGSGSFKVQNTAPGGLDFIVDVNGFFR